jgi:ferredoxin--NADP+ reductase
MARVGGEARAPRGLKRKLALMKDYECADPITAAAATSDAEKRRVVRFRFNLRPTAFSPAVNAPERVGAVEFDGGPTGSTTIECGAVITAIGYRGEHIPGFPFDEKTGAIPTDGATCHVRDNSHGNVYCSGWARNGPHGAILQALSDATDVAQTVVAEAGAVGDTAVTEGVRAERRAAVMRGILSRGAVPLGVDAVRRIWGHEEAAGAANGKRAEKMRDVTSMVNVAIHA